MLNTIPLYLQKEVPNATLSYSDSSKVKELVRQQSFMKVKSEAMKNQICFKNILFLTLTHGSVQQSCLSPITSIFANTHTFPKNVAPGAQVYRF